MSLQLKEHLNLSPYFVDTDKTPGFNWEGFQNKIDEISESLFGILVDDATSEFVKSLTQKYSQLGTQGSEIARIIRDVVISDVFIGDMPQELSRRLGINQAMAREVANLIVSQLFTSVLEDIKKMQAEKFPGRVAQRQAVPPQPRQNFAPQNLGGQASQKPLQKYQGEELPESGGNIIDLRNK